MKLISIPTSLLTTRYDGSMHPQNPDCKGLLNGANCQHFVYEALRMHCESYVPDFRSSELWADDEYTKIVSRPQALDIAFFNDTSNPYGAHIGIFVGPGQILHLCKEVGYPVVWDMEEFSKRKQYKEFIGVKRLKEEA